MHQLNVITVDGGGRADELLAAMQRLHAQGTLTLEDAVVVTHPTTGRVRVHQTADLTPGQGALAGGFWGLVLGTLLLGPAGGVAVGAATAGTGALMGAVIDAGVEEPFIHQVAEHLRPGRSAVILLTTHVDLPGLEAELARFAGATLTWSDLPPEARAGVERALEAHGPTDGVELTDDPPDA